MSISYPSEISSCTKDTNVMEPLREHILNVAHEMMSHVLSYWLLKANSEGRIFLHYTSSFLFLFLPSGSNCQLHLPAAPAPSPKAEAVTWSLPHPWTRHKKRGGGACSSCPTGSRTGASSKLSVQVLRLSERILLCLEHVGEEMLFFSW